jgi:hypothetical protein
MKKYSELADAQTVKNTILALKENGIDAYFVQTGKEAKAKVLSLIPEGSEEMNMSSVTLETIGLADELMESKRYVSVKKKLSSMDRNTQGKEMQKLGAAPEVAVGSVHAVTEDGKVIVASNTGSQLPAYAYGSSKVIWVVGAQKIVKDLDEGIKRIYDYVLPKESEHMHKLYNVPGSFVSKLLIFNREMVKGRITMIIVNEVLGF